MKELDVAIILERARSQAEEDRESINQVIAIVENAISDNPESVAYFMKELPKLYASRSKTVDQLMGVARILEKMQNVDDDNIDDLIEDLDIYSEESSRDEII